MAATCAPHGRSVHAETFITFEKLNTSDFKATKIPKWFRKYKFAYRKYEISHKHLESAVYFILLKYEAFTMHILVLGVFSFSKLELRIPKA
jgi:hypothetical protein